MSSGKEPHKSLVVHMKEQLAALWMGIFATKYACSCFWCFRSRPEDHIPFWTPDSSDDTINNTSVEYSNDTFEDATTHTSKHPSAQPAGVHKPVKSRLPVQNGRHPRKGSESESDDSVSLYLSETTSDQSDIEGRIRALHEELKRRKLEVERLKKEHKKNRKEKLRQKEEELKTKIEACDSYIQQVQSDLQKDRDQDPTSVKPVIKKPQANTKAPEERTERQRTDSENKPTSPDVKQALVSLPEKKAPISRKEQDKSELIESYSEDIPEDVKTATETQDRSEVKLKLDLTEQEDSRKLKEEKPVDTARSVTEIPEEQSVVTAPLSERTERSLHDKTPLRSVQSYSEYTEDNESERSDISRQSEKSYTSKSSYTDSTPTDSSTISKPQPSAGPAAVPEKKESIHTDEDISEHFSVESAVDTEADKPDDEDEGLTFVLTTTPTPQDAEEQQKIQPAEELKQVEPPAEEPKDYLPDFNVGDRILVDNELSGTVRFKGKTKFDSSFLVGVELDKAKGDNDGSKDGEVYFKCSEGHGLFTMPEKVSALPLDWGITQASLKFTEPLETGDLIDIAPPLSPSKIGEEESFTQDDSLTSLDRIISNAESAVKEFIRPQSPTEATDSQLTPRDLSETATTSIHAKKEPEKSFLSQLNDENEETEDLTKPAVDKERASEMVTENLVNEAINTMLDIHKKKQTEKETDESVKKSTEAEDEFAEVDLVLPTDNEVTVRPLVDDEDNMPPRPASPDIPKTPVIDKDELESLYKDIEGVTGADEYWADDDWPSTDQAPSPAVSAEMKLDLQKLASEVFYVVPNKEEDITKVVDTTVDVYWERRRYGENWDELEIPSSLCRPEGQGSDVEQRSKKVYKHLVFDLTGEILKDIYEDDEDIEQPPWSKPQPVKHKYYKGKQPPTIAEEVKPMVCSHVNKYLGVVRDTVDAGRISKLVGRKKKDVVDQILTAELREEEPDWVNYDADELSVKMQLSDAIFDSLLVETGKLFSGIMSDKNS